jgi:hypothetical protein
MLFEMLYEKQAFLVALLAASLLSLNVTELLAFTLLLSILLGLLKIGRRYFGAMKSGLMETVIQRPTLHGVLIRNGTLLILLNVINTVRDGCFGTTFTII